MSSIDAIQQRAGEAAFGGPLITNVHRGLIAEAIVAAALEPEWKWCAADYSAWDFERPDGLRLEVKQSAARQSWALNDKPSVCSFDIAERSSRWEGPTLITEAGRYANVYVFAHHPIPDQSADHRDPTQWRFFVVRTTMLPPIKRISLKRLEALAADCAFEDLKMAVDREAAGIAPRTHDTTE